MAGWHLALLQQTWWDESGVDGLLPLHSQRSCPFDRWAPCTRWWRKGLWYSMRKDGADRQRWKQGSRRRIHVQYRNRDHTVYGKELWKPSMNVENQILSLPSLHANLGVDDSWSTRVAGGLLGPQGWRMYRPCKESSLSSVTDHGLPQPKIKCPESLQSSALTLTTWSLVFTVHSTARAYWVDAKSNSEGCLTFCRTEGMVVVLFSQWWGS